MYGKITQL